MRAQLVIVVLSISFQVVAQRSRNAQLEELRARMDSLNAQRDELQAQLNEATLLTYAQDLRQLGYPALRTGATVVEHPGHALEYAEEYEQPRWVAHIVGPEIMRPGLARADSFSVDPAVLTGTAQWADYRNSGYDRGHMVPSADLRWSAEALAATYLYSNIAPQLPVLNRGAWAELEDHVRRWVTFTGERVFVVTGPVLREGLPVLGAPEANGHLAVPDLFFKVLLDLDGPSHKGIAFVMPNGLCDHPVMSYAVPVDSVETLTGIDFFPALADAEESMLEAQREPSAWYGKGDPFIGEVEPMRAPLPKGMFNTVQARHHVGSRVTVCGTVVSTRRTQRANALYLNFDRLHPHQDFYATIWSYNGPNFSYDPETYLLNKKVCVTGDVQLYEGIPRMSINNESGVVLWEEATK
jgi:endonuclease G, mitochondrial